MAQAFLTGTKLKLVFDDGVDENDKPKVKTKTFANIRHQLPADRLNAAAQAIGSLSALRLQDVEKNEAYHIG